MKITVSGRTDSLFLYNYFISLVVFAVHLFSSIPIYIPCIQFSTKIHIHRKIKSRIIVSKSTQLFLELHYTN